MKEITKETEAKPGHLKNGSLNLVQTERTRKVLSRKSRQQGKLEKLTAVLDWKAEK